MTTQPALATTAAVSASTRPRLALLLAAHDLAEAIRAIQPSQNLHPDTARTAVELIAYGTDGGRYFNDLVSYVAGTTADTSSSDSASAYATMDLVEALLVASDGTFQLADADAAAVVKILANQTSNRAVWRYAAFWSYLTKPTQTSVEVTARLLAAADEHAFRGPDVIWTNLHMIIADGKRPAPVLVGLVEEITGHPFDDSGVSPATARGQLPARLRAHLSRWVRREAYRNAGA